MYSGLLTAALIGLATTSSSILGAAIGLYAQLSKRLLACILAFAAGSLISALVIDLALKGSTDLHSLGYSSVRAWAFVAGGFALGATLYFSASLYLENRGAAIRRPLRFKEFALARKHEKERATVALLAQCPLLRHLPADAIEQILPTVSKRVVLAGETVFHAGDPADALYIVAHGNVEVINDVVEGSEPSIQHIAHLGPGAAFGEMGLISGGTRTATVRCAESAEVLMINKENFDKLLAADPVLSSAVHNLSHERALQNLSIGGTNPATWAKVAMYNLRHISRGESNSMLNEVGKGAGLAIVLGNILDTIPGCLVIGASSSTLANLSLTLVFGMFLGGFPEAAVSAAMLTKAGYKPRMIFVLWSAVLLAGIISAIAGKALIGPSVSLAAIFAQAIAGGAMLALVVHTMIPEAIHEGGSVVVLPTVAGFLFALFLSMISISS